MSLAKRVGDAKHRPEGLTQIGPIMRKEGLHNVRAFVAITAATPVHVSCHDRGGNRPARVEMLVKEEVYEQVQVDVIDTRIGCQFCSTSTRVVTWCRHIHWLLVNGHDAHLIENCTMIVDLPIIPSDGIYVRFMVRRSDAGFDHVQVVVNPLDGSDERYVTIGIAKRGSYGTRDVRNWYHDWITGTMHDRRYFHVSWRSGEAVTLTAGDGSKATISPLGQEIYQAVYGRDIADIEGELAHSANAPSF